MDSLVQTKIIAKSMSSDNDADWEEITLPMIAEVHPLNKTYCWSKKNDSTALFIHIDIKQKPERLEEILKRVPTTSIREEDSLLPNYVLITKFMELSEDIKKELIQVLKELHFTEIDYAKRKDLILNASKYQTAQVEKKKEKGKKETEDSTEYSPWCGIICI